ncbi:MAG: Xaa-Pro aminopeptidase, partial [Porticoccus sp.]
MITNQEFDRRRHQLMSMMPNNSIAILSAAPEKSRNRDVFYPYRQDSDFFYLAGFIEPESVLVLISGREQQQFLMFCRDRNMEREIWDGRRAGPEGARLKYGADDAFPIENIDEILPKLLEGRGKIYYTVGKDTNFDSFLTKKVENNRGNAGSTGSSVELFVNLEQLLHELRLLKSTEEQKVMEKAATISARAHCRAMRSCAPGVYEYQLQAEIEHEFAMAGASSPAYGTIVGGGVNGCILHYVENNSKLKDGDLVLIDAGCELHNYAADITRTFPVNGKYTDEQKVIYEIVLEAQISAIAACSNNNFWNDSHNITVSIITEGLRDIGILDGEINELIETKKY